MVERNNRPFAWVVKMGKIKIEVYEIRVVISLF